MKALSRALLWLAIALGKVLLFVILVVAVLLSSLLVMGLTVRCGFQGIWPPLAFMVWILLLMAAWIGFYNWRWQREMGRLIKPAAPLKRT